MAEQLWQQRARADAVIAPVFKSAVAGLLTPEDHHPDLALPLPRWLAELPGKIIGVKVSSYDLIPWAHVNDIIVVWFGLRAEIMQRCRHEDIALVVDTFGAEHIGHAIWRGENLTLRPVRAGKDMIFEPREIAHLGLIVGIQRAWLPDDPDTFLSIEFDLAAVDPSIPRGD